MRYILLIIINLFLLYSCNKKGNKVKNLSVDPVELIGERKEKVISFLGKPLDSSNVVIDKNIILLEYQSILYKHESEKRVLEIMWKNDEYGTIVFWFNSNNIAIDWFYWNNQFSY